MDSRLGQLLDQNGSAETLGGAQVATQHETADEQESKFSEDERWFGEACSLKLLKKACDSVSERLRSLKSEIEQEIEQDLVPMLPHVIEKLHQQCISNASAL